MNPNTDHEPLDEFDQLEEHRSQAFSKVLSIEHYEGSGIKPCAVVNFETLDEAKAFHDCLAEMVNEAKAMENLVGVLKEYGEHIKARKEAQP